jgi:xanthine dehydrogenase accessory factor
VTRCGRAARPRRLRRPVASAKRGAAIVAALRADASTETSRGYGARPARLGPSTQTEIAVAVLSELVAWRHGRRQDVGEALGAIAEAVDPVCGMSVPVAGARETAVHEGVTYYFCCPGCRGRFERNPAKYLAPRATWVAPGTHARNVRQEYALTRERPRRRKSST